jgi:hypothetical protein
MMEVEDISAIHLHYVVISTAGGMETTRATGSNNRIMEF